MQCDQFSEEDVLKTDKIARNRIGAGPLVDKKHIRQRQREVIRKGMTLSGGRE